MDSGGNQGRTDLDPPALSVVIPVYNEGGNITAVLRRLLTSVHTRPIEVLVVYDFDADSTVPVVRQLLPEMPELKLLRNQLAPGVLKALQVGLMAAAAPMIVVMMADGSDEPADIDKMVERAQAGAAVVSGSRYMRGGAQIGGPLLKRTLSRSAGLSLHWIGGLPTRDPTNNFRLYTRRLLDAVQIESTAGFELALELTVKAHLLGMPVAEVPTTWRDRTVGTSRFKLSKWIPHYLRWYLRALRGRVASRSSRKR